MAALFNPSKAIFHNNDRVSRAVLGIVAALFLLFAAKIGKAAGKYWLRRCHDKVRGNQKTIPSFDRDDFIKETTRRRF